VFIGMNVDGGGTLLQRLVVIADDDSLVLEVISDPESNRAFNRSVITSSSPN
jgi:hypothetical protein